MVNIILHYNFKDYILSKLEHYHYYLNNTIYYINIIYKYSIF